MIDKDAVIEKICEAFGVNVYPGDAFLQGSFEGCEPYEEVGFFRGKTHWTTLDAEILDAHYSALSFFSELEWCPAWHKTALSQECCRSSRILNN